MAQDTAYKGYLIRTNPMNGMIWIEKDKQRISNASSIADAKATIDMLTESTLRKTPFTMSDIKLPLTEMGASGILLSTVQKYYANLRNIGVSIRDASRGTEFALNVKNLRTNSAGNQVVYFEEETLREDTQDWGDRAGFQYAVLDGNKLISVWPTLPQAKHAAHEYYNNMAVKGVVTVTDTTNGAHYLTLR